MENNLFGSILCRVIDTGGSFFIPPNTSFVIYLFDGERRKIPKNILIQELEKSSFVNNLELVDVVLVDGMCFLFQSTWNIWIYYQINVKETMLFFFCLKNLHCIWGSQAQPLDRHPLCEISGPV